MSNHDELTTNPTAWQRGLVDTPYPMPSLDNSTAQLAAAYSARNAWWIDLAQIYATFAELAETNTEALPFIDAGHEALARANYWKREADAMALVNADENTH